MPSLMIHEKVGFEIGKKLQISSYDYYLGLMAPDTPNLNGFGPKEERWQAHLRCKSLQDWRLSLNEFYKNNYWYEKNFILGYYIHILTDIIYDDFLYKKVHSEIINCGVEEKDVHNVMREDMDNYYFEEWEDIKKILNSENKSYSILNIESEELLKWKKKFINKEISVNTSKYITTGVIEEIISCVYREVIDNKILEGY